MMNYLILHILFIVYALNTVLGRLAAPYAWDDWYKYVYFAGVLALLGIYALGWQLMLKRFNLGVAYANRSVVVVWGILLARLLLGEPLSWQLAVGTVMIVAGILLVSSTEREGGEA